LRVVLADDERPDLALLDLHMPEAGGLDVARLVKAKTTPSISLSPRTTTSPFRRSS